MQNRLALFVTLSITMLFSASVLANGDIQAGKSKAMPCEACHGKDGATTLDGQYPRLAGQYADYLARALIQYRSGERKNLIMSSLVRDQLKLTDQDIADLAAYYASLPGKLDDLSKHE